MKPMGYKYQKTVLKLETLLAHEHCDGCDRLTCAINVCFEDGYTLWSIELFSGTGAASKEYSRLYESLPKRFKADAERERKAFVQDTEYATCPHCNAVVWHTEHFDGGPIHCDSCARNFETRSEK